MSDRKKVYISIGEWQYKRKYRILYTGYVIGVGYAYVVYRAKTGTYNSDQSSKAYKIFDPFEEDNVFEPIKGYKLIMEQYVDYSISAIEESFLQESLGVPDVDSTKWKQFVFGLKNSFIAIDVGWYIYGSDNITTRSTRFVTRDEFKEPISWEGMGGDRNAFRHVLWQGYVTNKYGYEKALKLGNAHESNLVFDTNHRHFRTLMDADNVIDLLNNEIGRSIGQHCPPGTTMDKMALEILDVLYEDGLYMAHPTDKGTYYIDRTTITEEQYLEIKKMLLELNHLGRTSKEQKDRNEEAKKKLQQLEITWGTMK